MVHPEFWNWQKDWGMRSNYNYSKHMPFDAAKSMDILHIGGVRDIGPALPVISKKGVPCADIFEVTQSWLVDTGCPRDLVNSSQLQGHEESVFLSKFPHKIGTANGQVTTHTKLNIHSPLLGSSSAANVFG